MKKRFFLRKIEDESMYFDTLFIIGIIMIFSGLTLLILFNNKTYSLTFILSGALISLVSKYKTRKKR